MTFNIENEQTVVSVVVLCFNSAGFILETLESIRSQTYQSLELIVTDDCSQDNTVSLAQTWLDENKSRFKNCLLLTSPNNRGTSANATRGCKAASGTWAKLIAGDDLLLPHAISRFVFETQVNPRPRLFFSQSRRFLRRDDKNILLDQFPNKYDEQFFRLEANEQYKALLIRSIIPSLTIFIELPLLRSYGYFNELYFIIEDYPLFLILLENGEKIGYIFEVLCLYRMHEKAAVNRSSGSYMSSIYYSSLMAHYYGYLRSNKNISPLYRGGLYIRYLKIKVIVACNNKKNWASKIIGLLFDSINPLTYIYLLTRSKAVINLHFRKW